MAVANTLHNSSMILLHQRIAYPRPELAVFQLPSFHSAETCQAAACENAIIVDQFLTTSPAGMVVSPYMAFSIYISARVLLGTSQSCIIHTDADLETVHACYYGVPLPSDFWSMLDCLDRMDVRWKGQHTLSSDRTMSIFRHFASRLREIHIQAQRQPDHHVGMYDDIADINGCDRQQDAADPFIRTPASFPARNETEHPQSKTAHPVYNTRVSEMQAVAPTASEMLSMAAEKQPSQAVYGDSDELAAISHLLTEPQYADLDRIVSFDDMMLAARPED